jgi:type IV pilus assembly protein PilA
MLKTLRTKMQDDKGFTLIELMVVVLIIAILIAIAIPTFLGLRRRAQDRAAQSNLRNGMTAAKAFYTDNETYTGFNAAAGLAIEPSLTWADGGAATLNTVHIKAVEAQGGVAGQALTLATESASTTDFCIADSSLVGTRTGPVDAANFAACVGGW